MQSANQQVRKPSQKQTVIDQLVVNTENQVAMASLQKENKQLKQQQGQVLSYGGLQLSDLKSADEEMPSASLNFSSSLSSSPSDPEEFLDEAVDAAHDHQSLDPLDHDTEQPESPPNSLKHHAEMKKAKIANDSKGLNQHDYEGKAHEILHHTPMSDMSECWSYGRRNIKKCSAHAQGAMKTTIRPFMIVLNDLTKQEEVSDVGNKWCIYVQEREHLHADLQGHSGETDSEAEDKSLEDAGNAQNED
ncbi:hypothetical protein IW261DRAFT_1424479 [Armillaria novae-zelandiae]|uniref:Uncharacterized protein n=1 Tax=Armillaria novae-zelandiae TaxID=153914 RepID=A0AA39TWU0_9AGAR|nr:hypothetical protein IW261DRAFT_1424479 [Armillaria novae-zelandiae]